MNNYFVLEKRLAECPVYWRNFIKYLKAKYNLFFNEISDDILKPHLRKYNAKIMRVNSSNTEAVFFKNQKDLTWFILEWS